MKIVPYISSPWETKQGIYAISTSLTAPSSHSRATAKYLLLMPASDLAKPLVSGRVNADTYKVREGRVINKKISVKKNWPFPLLCKAVPKTGSFRWNNSSFKRLTTPAPMRSTGGRLFVDVTRMLSSSESRQTIIDNLGKSDPLIKDALQTLMERVL